jgi:hypothetical protein
MSGAAQILLTLMLGGVSGSAGPAQSVEQKVESFRVVAPDGCARQQSPSDEIVICGSRRRNEKYRLPLRDERESIARFDRVRGDVPRASLADPAGPTRCGIFEGERRCSKEEAAEFGYYGGRDPLSFGAKVVERIAHPD